MNYPNILFPGTPRVVHPKSDANRKSLVNSMKDILIFKSLDQEQLNEVVDAMFERKVVGGEHVITQVSHASFCFIIIIYKCVFALY